MARKSSLWLSAPLSESYTNEANDVCSLIPRVKESAAGLRANKIFNKILRFYYFFDAKTLRCIEKSDLIKILLFISTVFWLVEIIYADIN